MKKRLIAMLLCLFSLFTFCGCSFRTDKCKLTGTYELSGVQKNDVYYKKGDLYYGMIVGGEIISLKIHSNWTFEGKISYTSDVSFEVKGKIKKERITNSFTATSFEPAELLSLMGYQSNEIVVDIIGKGEFKFSSTKYNTISTFYLSKVDKK